MAFVTGAAVGASTWTPRSESKSELKPGASARFTMNVGSAKYSPFVDEFFAKDVTRQYIAKACPTGVPPVQCIEGTTFDEPWASKTLKRQSQLRYRQLPVSVRIHNMYETRKAALIACHGCSHEEDRVLKNPMMASAMLLGKAEADRACNRYIESSGPAEDMMCRSVENVYMKAVNGSGVFTTACTDGQAKYEAYLMKVRCGSTTFRAKQYSPAAKAGAAFAARKMAIARNHICVYEDGLYSKYPRMAGSIRPAFGYYQPFVTSPVQTATNNGMLDPNQAAALAALGSIGKAAARSLTYDMVPAS